MALNHQALRGLGYVPSYQASAVPFLTSSLTIPVSTSEPIVINFNTVTRFITVTNTNSVDDPNYPLRFGFSRNGIKGVENNNYIVLNNGDSYDAELRVTKVFLLSDSTAHSSSGSVIAGLTDINSSLLQTNWSGSMGVG
jgi:hypothetical protein